MAAASTLIADTVTLGPLDGEIEYVGWCHEADGTHLIVSRDFATSDGYCLVTTSGVHYGGVQAAEVRPGETRLAVTPEAADALGVTTTMVMKYDPAAVDESQLRVALERILGLP